MVVGPILLQREDVQVFVGRRDPINESFCLAKPFFAFSRPDKGQNRAGDLVKLVSHTKAKGSQFDHLQPALPRLAMRPQRVFHKRVVERRFRQPPVHDPPNPLDRDLGLRPLKPQIPGFVDDRRVRHNRLQPGLERRDPARDMPTQTVTGHSYALVDTR